MEWKLLFLAYLLGINLLTFIFMWYDKHQAKRGKWRVSEKKLLLLGIIGGGFGGFLAQRIFRHKTKKPIFYSAFIAGIIIDTGCLYWLYMSGWGIG